ncbi:MAG: hypothetical protein A2722_04330 [Candidatus Doudnabacteria bacterium RIFCSPHIGHO2_01_FULL_50_11]|uniref:tRNA/rRNA methyltransferase SpoU type domain-containing protein n=1 Tax=Candidatus Doudnabacteria bacterium RIFCSPHIGHO2_01_FULL_50_11 TaxID=1817828 RepID=A0A1F5PGC9_9BACT|nr:MAG: hypothetical protein A2722_04330 [Candidatus Doudnabacteria bacterium RIFCSPHIGHO2_01_FULL_50_11]HLC44795.1 TrmH family RNA methyltransferase [Patescibacteria group bacterium]
MSDKTFYLIAHNIRSLYNVGSIFRIADSFRVSKIYLTGYSGTPHNVRLRKTALGAEQNVPWEYSRQVKRLIHTLKQKKITIVGLENNISGTTLLNKFRPRFPLALLLGEEIAGIQKPLLRLCDSVVEIPMHGEKESLNVAVACGIACYHIRTEAG